MPFNIRTYVVVSNRDHKQSKTNGVKYLLTISTEDKSYRNILNILEKYDCVYGTYGIHPHEAKLHKHIKSDEIIKNLNKNNKIIGVGETGLDFYYNHSEKSDQISCFKSILMHQ